MARLWATLAPPWATGGAKGRQIYPKGAKLDPPVEKHPTGGTEITDLEPFGANWEPLGANLVPIEANGGHLATNWEPIGCQLVKVDFAAQRGGSGPRNPLCHLGANWETMGSQLGASWPIGAYWEPMGV